MTNKIEELEQKKRRYEGFIKRHEYCQNELCKKDVQFCKQKLQEMKK